MNKSSRMHNEIKRSSTVPRARRAARQDGLVPAAIGLDVGDRQSHFCILADDGQTIAEGKVPTTPEALRQFLAGLIPTRVALESGTHSGWISRLAESLKHEAIVANPRELRKIHQSDRKNDRADAQVLARMARFDPQLLAPIQHRSAEMQADIAMIRARDTLVGARTKFVNAVRGHVKTTGKRLTRCSTRCFARQVTEQLPSELHEALLPMVQAIAALSEQIQVYDRQIAVLAKTRYPVTQVLRQVNGVGPVTSVAFVLTLADPLRFTKSRDVGAYLGLVPRQDDSGDRVSQLPITKAGNRLLRRLLVGSAQYILGPFGPDCDLRRYGEKLMQRGGKNAKKRAVVGVARKLAVLLHRLWTTGEMYCPLRNSQEVSKAA